MNWDAFPGKFKKRGSNWVNGQHAIGIRPKSERRTFPFSGGYAFISRLKDDFYYAITYDNARCPEDVKEKFLKCVNSDEILFFCIWKTRNSIG